jgi:hypothetical protein
MDTEISLDELVEFYIAIRNERELRTRKFEEEDAIIKADLTTLETKLLGICTSVNANSINTKNGTVIRSLKERYVCSDWDNFKKFIRENDAVDCLERRIHQGNFKQLLKDTAEDGLPPGVNVMREYAITVRKPSSKE